MDQLYNYTKCTMGGSEKYLVYMSADHCAVSSLVLFLNLCERDIIVLSPIPTYLEVYMCIAKDFSPCFFFLLNFVFVLLLFFSSRL
jgi:hypothetical protein